MDSFTSKIERLFADKLTINNVSKKNYITKLQFLNKSLNKKPLSTFTFLYARPHKIVTYLENKYTKYQSRVAYYNAIWNLLSSLPTSKKINDAIQVYNEERNKAKRGAQSNTTYMLTEEEIHNKWLSHEELLKIPEKIAEDLINKFKKVFLSPRDLNNLKATQRKQYLLLLTQYITLSFVAVHPLRLVIHNIPIVNREINSNCLIVTRSDMILHLVNYKTARRYGTLNIKINKNIQSMLRKFYVIVKMINGSAATQMLYMFRGGRFIQYKNTAAFGKSLTILLKKYTNKHITMTTLRKILETTMINKKEYDQMTLQEKDAYHRELLHSTEVANRAYLKKTGEEPYNLRLKCNPYYTPESGINLYCEN